MNKSFFIGLFLLCTLGLYTTAHSSVILEVHKVGTGKGVITSTPAGLSCGATCVLDFLYLPGTTPTGTATLTVVPDVGSRVSKWSIPGCSGNSCQLVFTNKQSITVTIDRLAGVIPPATISVSPITFSFLAQQNAASPATQILTITTSSSWSIRQVPTWLKVSLLKYNTVQLTAVQTGLAPGNYTGTLILAAPGAADTNIPVALSVVTTPVAPVPFSVDRPLITIAGRQFGQTGTNPAPQTVVVKGVTTFTTAITFPVTTPVPYIRVDAFKGFFNIQALLPGLLPGVYDATIIVSSPGQAAQTVLVSLTVQKAPTLAIHPTSINFIGSNGGPSIRPRIVNIMNGGTGTLGGVSVTMSPTPIAWLGVTSTPSSLLLTANPTGLADGVYTGTLTVSSTTAIIKTITITVTLTVVPPASLVTTGVATVGWDKNPDAVLNVSGPTDGYRLYRSETSGVYPSTPLLEIPHPITMAEIVDSGMVLGPNVYFFRVTAFNTFGESGPSNEVSMTFPGPTSVGVIPPPPPPPPAPTVAWADITLVTTGVVQTRMSGTLAGLPFSVDVTGPILPPQLGAATEVNFFKNFQQTYTNPPAVTNSPGTADAIRIIGPGTYTIVFSAPVTNPILAILSLGGTSTIKLTFVNQPVVLLKTGPGNWGTGTPLVVLNNTVTGKEGNGLIQFPGTMTSLTFTSDLAENWWGFTVGVPIPIP